LVPVLSGWGHWKGGLGVGGPSEVVPQRGPPQKVDMPSKYKKHPPAFTLTIGSHKECLEDMACCCMLVCLAVSWRAHVRGRPKTADKGLQELKCP
jgi:hypothetical protein